MTEIPKLFPEISQLAETDLTNSSAVRKAGFRMEEMFLQSEDLKKPDISSLANDTLKRLQQIYEQYETSLENDFARRLLSGEVDKVETYPMYDRFQRLIAKETEMAKVKEDDKVLFIGNCPFPISPILISRITGAKIDCYEQNDEAVGTSKKVIEKMGMSEKIKVVKSTGQKGSTHGNKVIFVALLAQPKQNIMTNVWQHTGPDSRVICRTSEGNRNVFYQGISENELTGFRHFTIEDMQHAGVDDTISSYLLKPDRNPDKV